MSFRKKLAVGATAAILGLVLGATVLGPSAATAQESSTTTTTSDTANETRPLIQSRLREALDELVAAGTITAAQADAVAEHLASMEGPAGDPGRGWHRGRGWGGANLDTAADVIGIETAALIDGLKDGQSIADVATANGADPAAVIEALVAAHQARLDEAVASGSLTTEEAAERAERAVDRITSLVNGEFRRGLDGAPPVDEGA